MTQVCGGAGKAKRLAPADPVPTSVAPPEEDKLPVAGSCVASGACTDYEGTFTGVDLQALCSKEKGTFKAGACPVEKTVATCQQRQIGSDDRIVIRSYAPMTVDAAKKACGNTPRGIFLKASAVAGN